MRSQKKVQNEVSLHDCISTDNTGNEITLIDIVQDDSEQIIEAVALKMQIKRLYQRMKNLLHGRERLILTWRFGLNNAPVKTQSEIAKELGISRSYVSRIEKKALQKLKTDMELDQDF